jgi:hypothetical protein
MGPKRFQVLAASGFIVASPVLRRQPVLNTRASGRCPSQDRVHLLHDVSRCRGFGSDPRKIPEVPLRFSNDLGVVVSLDLLVASDNKRRRQRRTLIKVGDPLITGLFAGFRSHHVDAVVCKVTGDSGVQRRTVKNGRVIGVGLADRDHLQLVAFKIDRVGRQSSGSTFSSAVGTSRGTIPAQYAARPGSEASYSARARTAAVARRLAPGKR